ncbi:class I SAM-dependent methyltransferase [Mesorhizobium sp. ZMM04-5]|uniref:Class I SAM-dependent methyltransferase n=1 Tax=Mesorhizobium marinum TaxID=3228790 RepID=A0ABV3QW65_9HYPH
MVRDEIGIVDAWIDHAQAIFDFAYFVDHGSTDGTYERLVKRARDWPGMVVLRYLDAAFAKRDVLRLACDEALVNTDADWFFYLDPDEFFPYASRDELAARLQRAEETGIALFNWRNCYLSTPTSTFGNSAGFRQVRTSAIGKVAIIRRIAADPSYEVTLGAHSVWNSIHGAVPPDVVGELYHFPIRSPEQLWRKVLGGTRNFLRARMANPGSGVHGHYPALLGTLATSPDWQNVPALVWDYGERVLNRPARVDSSEFEPFTATFVGVKAEARAQETEPADLHDILTCPKTLPLLKQVIELSAPSLIKLPDSLYRIAGGVIVPKLNLADRTFSKLEHLEDDSITLPDLVTALQSAFWKIGDPAASTWGEHIPFLFSLMTLFRPRRYVELGVFGGASFLAACQAVRATGTQASCVGIDTWAGDPHTGSYASDVFDSFVSKLRKYDDYAGYIRGDFNEALPRFEDGSIDLLHIDGFHTIEAVQNDFDSWLPKMSDRGIIIFHDINEFHADFGVWRFWRSVRTRYPHFEFGHGHGLGVLLVGEACPLRKPIDGSQVPFPDGLANDFLQVIFGGIGKLAWEQARPPKAAALQGVGSGDMAGLRARLVQVEMERDALLNSTSWKLTAPLRAVVSKLRR